MVFVTADSCRLQLEQLSRMLVSTFPGSTIYRHTDLRQVSHVVFNHKVEAVFLEAVTDKINSFDFMRMLHRQNPELPVFIIAKAEGFREEAKAAGARGCFILPDEEPQLLEAIRLAINKENVL